MTGHSAKLTWEEAVRWYCGQPGNEQAVLDNYFDEDVVQAAERFSHSREFSETMKLIPQSVKKVLEIGAGRGIASYAFARSGFDVTALEPDPSNFVGAGAIRLLVGKSGAKIRIVEEYGERLPFEDGSFDVVYVRQVLHHASDLRQFCAEIARILVANGTFLAVREHVLDTAKDLEAFLKTHPLHHLYGGEKAYTLREYKSSIVQGGLKIKKIFRTYDTDINLFPLTQSYFYDEMIKRLGFKVPLFFLGIKLKLMNLANHQPGRLFSFIGYKP